MSPGHELASLIYSIYIYYENKMYDYDIIISNQVYELGNMFVSILLLYFDKSKIHFIDNIRQMFILMKHIYLKHFHIKIKIVFIFY